jgi:predicted MFS family arabinose efflux permease
MTQTASLELPSADSASRRWLIPLGGALALIVGNGPISVFAFGVFMGPLESEFGWSRGSLGVAMGLCALLSAASLPVVGFLMDRFGVRRLLLAAIFLFGLNVAVIGSSTGLAAFILVTAVTGITGAAQSPIGYVKSISSHFDRRRGLAIGIAMSGIGIGTALIPQYVQWLISQFGWRTAYVGLGMAIVALAVPGALLLREPARAGEAGSGGSSPVGGLTFGEASRLRSFWFIAAAVLLVSMAVNGMLVHVVPLLKDRGWNPAEAARILVAAGAAGILGRLLAGYLMDRVYAPYVAASFFALAVIGIYLIASNASPVLGMAAIGLAAGAEVDMIAFFVSRYFGLRHFGQLYGALFSIFTIGAGLGPFLLGTAFTRLGNYDLGFTGCGAFLAVASVCILLVGEYIFGPAPSTPT